MRNIGMKLLAVLLLLIGGTSCIAGIYVNVQNGSYFTAILPLIALVIVLAFVRSAWNRRASN